LGKGWPGKDRYRKQRRQRRASTSKNPKDSHLPLPIIYRPTRCIEAKSRFRSSTLASRAAGKKGHTAVSENPGFHHVENLNRLQEAAFERTTRDFKLFRARD